MDMGMDIYNGIWGGWNGICVVASVVIAGVVVVGFVSSVTEKIGILKHGMKFPEHPDSKTKSVKFCAGQESSKSFSAFIAMGVVEPFPEVTAKNWMEVVPEKIYQFKDKYFLTMGLQSTTVNNIVHVNSTYLSRLSARRTILSSHPSVVACLSNEAAELAAKELYTYLVQHLLPTRYPNIFTLLPSSPSSPPHLQNAITHATLPLTPPNDAIAALKLLTQHVDEDFLILLPSEDGDGYSLQAYIWCYPVGFSPPELLGMKLRDIHGMVPGYKNKLEGSMDRYFGKLEVGKVVVRRNWSIATDPELYIDVDYHVHESTSLSATSTTKNEDIDLSQTFVRCELQTLFALPVSGARVLAVHLFMYPLQQFKDDGEAEGLASAIEGLKKGNVPQIWTYKRAGVWGEKVLEFLGR